MKRYFDTVILGLGIFFLGFTLYLVYERHAPPQSAYAQNSESQLTTPTHLSIPSLALELPILPAQITDNKWDITKEGISYLTTSPLPGGSGNSVMYGHNWANLLGRLKHIKTGAVIEVKNSDGITHRYIVHFISIVTPDETHIYNNTADARLTLYTCTGFLDSKRLVVTAILK